MYVVKWVGTYDTFSGLLPFKRISVIMPCATEYKSNLFVIARTRFTVSVWRQHNFHTCMLCVILNESDLWYGVIDRHRSTPLKHEYNVVWDSLTLAQWCHDHIMTDLLWLRAMCCHLEIRLVWQTLFLCCWHSSWEILCAALVSSSSFTVRSCSVCWSAISCSFCFNSFSLFLSWMSRELERISSDS